MLLEAGIVVIDAVNAIGINLGWTFIAFQILNGKAGASLCQFLADRITEGDEGHPPGIQQFPRLQRLQALVNE